MCVLDGELLLGTTSGGRRRWGVGHYIAAADHRGSVDGFAGTIGGTQRTHLRRQVGCRSGTMRP